MRDSNLKLNPKKCNFLRKEIIYLGHKCSEEGIKPDQRLIKSITDSPQPKNPKQLMSFLVLANYYRKFIKDFAKIAGPLYHQIKKHQKFEWNTECTEAFVKLKKSLTTQPVLTYPDFSKEFSITCDTSGQGVGAVLEQEGRVVCYASKTLNPTQNR